MNCNNYLPDLIEVSIELLSFSFFFGGETTVRLHELLIVYINIYHM